VRKRELGPFFNQCGIGIGEEPEQRGNRVRGRIRPIAGRSSRKPGLMPPRSPSRTRLHAEPRCIGQEGVGRALVATDTVDADRHRRAQRAETLLR
jgi:hypothetical protein